MDESKKLLFSIPDFFGQFQLNMMLITMMKEHPEYFMDDVVIDSVYGSFPGCIWNSGRAYMGQADYENITGTVGNFNQQGVSVRFTFTNSLVKAEHVGDYYCNAILKACAKLVPDGPKNGVNVNANVLARHIKEKYPDYYLMWSTTKVMDSIGYVNELSKDRITVLNYNFNNKDEAIDALLYPKNIEVLVNEACIDDCPNRQEHYAAINNLQLIQPSTPFRCPHGAECYYYYETVPTRHHHITPEMCREYYLPRGINKFKIAGRHDSSINLIENYVIYLCKPEWKDHVRNMLLHYVYHPQNAQIIDRFKHPQPTNSDGSPMPPEEVCAQCDGTQCPTCGRDKNPTKPEEESENNGEV